MSHFVSDKLKNIIFLSSLFIFTGVLNILLESISLIINFCRSCEGIAEVATCKETFNLFYYETDRDEATTTFPPWNEEAYTKVNFQRFFLS